MFFFHYFYIYMHSVFRQRDLCGFCLASLTTKPNTCSCEPILCELKFQPSIVLYLFSHGHYRVCCSTCGLGVLLYAYTVPLFTGCTLSRILEGRLYRHSEHVTRLKVLLPLPSLLATIWYQECFESGDFPGLCNLVWYPRVYRL